MKNRICKKWCVFIFLLFFTVTNVCAQKIDINVNGFTNTNYQINNKGKSDFFIGQYDNLVTARITDKISFLSEVVFEYDEGFVIDVERVIIKYDWDNYLNVKMGKFHNPLGYWNNAYHHGAVLQPTIARPLAVNFEDEGGVLPIHNNGIWVSGHDIGKWKFGYDLTVGNGIGSNLYVKDDNNKKSLGTAFEIKPVKNLEFGISTYKDKLIKGEIAQNGDSLATDLSILIGAADMVYLSNKFEFIGEYFLANHQPDGQKKASKVNAGFIYTGLPLKKITPYIRYDWINFPQSHVYYTPDNVKKLTVGAKYEFSYLSNIKLEVSNSHDKINGQTNAAAVSFGIGF
jgi:hypothetical protein